MVLPKLKRHLNVKNTLSDHDNIHGHRNLNYTKRSAIARYRNFNAPKICKITVLICVVMTTHGHDVHALPSQGPDMRRRRTWLLEPAADQGPWVRLDRDQRAHDRLDETKARRGMSGAERLG